MSAHEPAKDPLAVREHLLAAEGFLSSATDALNNASRAIAKAAAEAEEVLPPLYAFTRQRPDQPGIFGPQANVLSLDLLASHAQEVGKVGQQVGAWAAGLQHYKAGGP